MEVLDIITRSLLAACGGSLLTLIVAGVRLIIKKFTTDDLAMKALLHDAYMKDARPLLAPDEISEAELENHNKLYAAYHAQKLNGTGDKIHEEILKKKVVPS